MKTRSCRGGMTTEADYSRAAVRGVTFTMFAALAVLLATASASASALRDLTPADIQEVDKLLEGMSPAEKLGQMFIVGFVGTKPSPGLVELINRCNIGGVILYKVNLEDQRGVGHESAAVLQSLVRLTNALQDSVPHRAGRPLPLLIAADQENGASVIVESGFTVFPNNLAFGHVRDKDRTFRAGRVVGEELRAVGININLAPVVDVNTNTKNDIIDVRAFGGNSALVMALGVEFMKGLRAGGVLAVGKHYPGHGETSKNPLDELPSIPSDMTHIEQFMLPPFKALIANGVDAIMTAHMVVPSMRTQQGMPVSLSPEVIRDLRESRGFRDGVVITDDLTNMGAITKHWKVPEAINFALDARNDIILLAEFHQSVEFKQAKFIEFFDATVRRLKEPANRAFLDQVTESARRILRMKKRVNQSFSVDDWKVPIDGLETTVRQPQSLILAREIADRSVVLITDGGKVVDDVKNSSFAGQSGPLKRVAVTPRARILVVTSVFYPPDLLYEGLRARQQHEISNVKLIWGYKRKELLAECSKLWQQRCSLSPWDNVNIAAKAQEITERLLRGDVTPDTPVIFSIVTNEHVKVLSEVLKRVPNRRFVVLGLRAPNLLDTDLLLNPMVTFIAAGSGEEPSINALIRALYGDLEPRPISYASVSIGGADNRIADRAADLGAPISGGASASAPGDSKLPGVLRKVGIWIAVVGGSISAIVLGALARLLERDKKDDGRAREQAAQRWWLRRQLWTSLIWGTVVLIVARVAVPAVVEHYPSLEAVARIPEYRWVIPCVLAFVGAYLGSRILELLRLVKGSRS